MNIIIFSVLIFLELIQWIVIIDIILSWLLIFWLNLRPKFIADIIDPMYAFVKKHIPTSIWPFDFTPMVIFLIIIVLTILIQIFFPVVYNNYAILLQSYR